MANNYGRPVIGSAEDVERLGRREVDSFFKKYYGPQSLTVTIVGDVDPSQVLLNALEPSCYPKALRPTAARAGAIDLFGVISVKS